MLLVRDCMTKTVRTLGPRDTVAHAREVMVRERINQLPIVAHGKLVGIVTDRDLREVMPTVFEAASHAAHRDRKWTDPSELAVEEIMTPDLVTMGPADSVADAASRLRAERIGSAPVLEDGKLVGILTRSDLLDALVAIERKRGA
ncbi:MAG TPA: CBS domain-containing protein [Candidatus Binatia bacterium]|jgi:acetoin utilization protein AcuB